MIDRLQFQKKLADLVRSCNNNGRMTDVQEVEAFFDGDNLSDEQMELVYDFLLSQKIIVKGYIKRGGTVIPAEKEGKDNDKTILTAEEEQFLKTYEAEVNMMGSEEPLAYYLPKVIHMAKELKCPEIFLGDLIQEGNVGLILGLEREGAAEAEILQMARRSMEALLEEQTEVRVQDRKMVEQVQNLDEQIKRLTEEMGRKVSVDELAEFSELTEEEITDILKLAGEEIPEEEV